MTETAQQLNANVVAAQLVFSGVVALATVVYAVLTWKLVTETRRMRKAQTDAKVVVRLESDPRYFNVLDLVIKNEGAGPAHDVFFDVGATGDGKGDPSLVEEIRALGFVERGLNYISPGQEVRSFLTSMVDDFDRKVETAIAVDVTYWTAAGEFITERYWLDFSIFRGLSRLGETDMATIAKAVKDIAKDVHDLASGWHKLEVITQDKSEYRDEQKQRRDALRAELEGPVTAETSGGSDRAATET